MNLDVCLNASIHSEVDILKFAKHYVKHEFKGTLECTDIINTKFAAVLYTPSGAPQLCQLSMSAAMVMKVPSRHITR